MQTGQGAAMGGQNKPMLPAQMQEAAALGAAKLKEFGSQWWALFFVAGLCVTASGVLTVISLTFTSFAPFDVLSGIYVAIFGLMMTVLDVPAMNVPRVTELRHMIRRYFLFTTRFAGRGFWYLFLGCSSFALLWNNNVSPFLGFILGGYVSALGIACLIVGLQKTIELNKLRLQLKANYARSMEQCPPAGMTKVFLSQICTQNGRPFSDEELGYVMNALASFQGDQQMIRKEDFGRWLEQDSLTLL